MTYLFWLGSEADCERPSDRVLSPSAAGPVVSAHSGNAPSRIAQQIMVQDAYLVDYLLGWAGLAEPRPWGAAMGFALEVASGYGLIRGESDATLTELGKMVAAELDASE